MHIRHDLTERLRAAAWNAFEAEGRSDGMQLIFELHPDLIVLEAIPEEDTSQDLLESIRFFTDIPLVLLSDHPLTCWEHALEASKVLVLTQPMSNSKVISNVRNFWKATGKLSQRKNSAALFSGV